MDRQENSRARVARVFCMSCAVFCVSVWPAFASEVMNRAPAKENRFVPPLEVEVIGSGGMVGNRPGQLREAGSPPSAKARGIYSEVESMKEVLKPLRKEKRARINPRILLISEDRPVEKRKATGKSRKSRKVQVVDDNEVWFKKGLEYGTKNEYGNAITAYTAAIQADAQDASSYYNRGVIHQLCARYDLAIRDYTQASEIAVDDPDAYYNRALSYQYSGQPDLAVQDYTRAIALSGDDAASFWNRGVAFSYTGKETFALSDFNVAIDLSRITEKHSSGERAPTAAPENKPSVP